MSKVLITGGCGFVGRHLVDAFADRGDEVTALDLHAEPWRDDVNFISLDIRDKAGVDAAVQGNDVVIHNASLVHTKWNRIDDVWDVNLGGTESVLGAAQAHGVKRFVYISSASAVYEGSDIENGDETMPYPSVSQAPYADSKIAAEKLVLASANEVLGTCAIRPHVVFGPHDKRFLPAILAKAKNGQLKFSVGRQRKLSDFTYVSNLVDATLAAADKVEPGSPVSGQAYFVTNGEPRAFWDFIDQVLDELGLPATKYRVPYRVAYFAASIAEGVDTLRGGTLNAETGLTRFAIRYMCTHHYFSIDKAHRDLDWTPAVDLNEGIRRTVAHLRETGTWN